MNIVDIVNDIVQKKTGTLINSSEYNETISNNFLLQRWVSMTSSDNLHILNETTNKLYDAFESDKERFYKALLVVTNKPANEKFIYLKKTKTIKDEKTNKLLTTLATRNECNKKDIEEYLEILKLIDNKQVENIKKEIV